MQLAHLRRRESEKTLQGLEPWQLYLQEAHEHIVVDPDMFATSRYTTVCRLANPDEACPATRHEVAWQTNLSSRKSDRFSGPEHSRKTVQ